MTRRDTRLYRDTEQQKLGGVCSGLARYFDLDPLLVRVGFVAAIFISGVSILAYLLLWWLVDPAPAGHWSDAAETGGATADAANGFPPPTATDAGGERAA